MITVFQASLWDGTTPLDPALMPDFCHRCHRSVARLAGLLITGPYFVLCPDCYSWHAARVMLRGPASRAARRAAGPLWRLAKIVVFVVALCAIFALVQTLIGVHP